jgi:hypothetical protein
MVSRTQALRTGLAGTGGSGTSGFFNNTIDDCNSHYDENINEFVGSQKLVKRRFSEKPNKKVLHKA